MCRGVLQCLCIFLRDNTHNDQKRALDSLVTKDCELLDVGAGHWTPVLWKSER